MPVTISPDQTGAYELDVPAGTPTQVVIPYAGAVLTRGVEVIHHAGDDPLYVGAESLQPRDPDALAMVMPGTGVQIDLTVAPDHGAVSVWLVSATRAVVSVSKAQP